MARALIVAAPGSGHGKTLVTAGLARALLDAGERVQLFKVGPDYLDPLFLENATGLEVRQLDYWLHGADGIAAMLGNGAGADCVLIEGMMGLFDGDYPVARLAAEFDLPVLLVVDASAMAQTFGAVVHGLASYDPRVRVAGVIANRVGSPGHGDMLRDSVQPPAHFLGWLQHDAALQVEQRHLGIDALTREQADALARRVAHTLAPMVPRLHWQEQALQRPSPSGDTGSDDSALHGRRIAVARDAAFCFLYRANIDFLRDHGADVHWFSPLADTALPECDAVYLPGGYPELHLQALSGNAPMKRAMRDHIEGDRPCVAECGGLLYLLRELGWQGQRAAMVGVLPGSGEVAKALAAIGYQQWPDSTLRGHTFHHAQVSCELEALRATHPDGRPGEALYRHRNTLASFVHWHFASDSQRVCGWFRGEFSA